MGVEKKERKVTLQGGEVHGGWERELRIPNYTLIGGNPLVRAKGAKNTLTERRKEWNEAAVGEKKKDQGTKT